MYPDIPIEAVGFFVVLSEKDMQYIGERNHAYRNPVKYYIKAISSYKGMYIIPVNVKKRH